MELSASFRHDGGMAIDAELSNGAVRRRDAVPALLAWLVFLSGQVVLPVYLLWAAAWEGWASSYDGVTGAGRSTAGAAVLVSAGAWLVQATLTGYRRRRGSPAAGGFVFVVIGALTTLGCAALWATMR